MAEGTFTQRHPVFVQALEDAIDLSWTQVGVPLLGVIGSFVVSLMNDYNANRLDWRGSLRSLIYSLLIGIALYVVVAIARAPFKVQARKLSDFNKRLDEALAQGPLQSSQTPASLGDIEHIIERTLEQSYDLKKLEPNFVDI